MLRIRQILLAAPMVCASVAAAQAQLPTLTLSAVSPAGGRIGTTFEVALTAVIDDDGIDRLLFSHPDIKAAPAVQPSVVFAGKTEIVPNKFQVTIGPNVPPGVYDVRAAGTFGVSNPRAFAVDQWNEATEPAGNQTAATAAVVELGTVVNGTANANAEDWFKFTAKQGQRVLIDVLGRRIDSKMDPTLVVYDSQGRELVRSGDVNRRDPLVDLAVPADGDYVVKLYDFTFGGGNEHFYRMAIHNGPYVDFVFPPVVRVGQKNKLAVYGRNLPGGVKADGVAVLGRPLEKLEIEIDVPANETVDRRAAPSLVTASESFIDAREYRLKSSAGTSNAVALGYTDEPVVAEKEPNDTPEQSQAVAVPCEVVGQFHPRGDIDGFTFDAKKGDVVAMEVVSQRMGFTADPAVIVQQVNRAADGKTTFADVKELDDESKSVGGGALDSGTNDPFYLFTAPADGTFRVVVRDLYGDGRGDPRLIYRLALRKPRPDFRLVALPVPFTANRNDNNGQAYKPGGTFVRAGDTTIVTVFAARKDGFAGEIRVRAEGLPAGVAAAETVIAAGQDTAPLSIVAAESAAPWCGPIKISGRALVDGKEAIRLARPTSIMLAGAQRKPADVRLAQELILAVGAEKMPVTIDVGLGKTYEVARGAKLDIPVKVTRRGDFKEQVQLNPVGLPQNVKVANVTLSGSTSDGKLVIEPAANAPLGEFSLFMSSQAKIKYVRDKAGADAADKTKKEMEKAVADLNAASETAKKAAAAAPKEKKADADKAAAEAAAKAKSAADALKAFQTRADAKTKAAAVKDINNVPLVSSHVVVRIVEKPVEKKDDKK